MKPVFLFLWTLAFYFHAFSQKEAPIRSGELIKTAEQLYDSGEHKKSLSLIEQIDPNDSNYVRSLYGRALIYEADSQLNKAITLCEEVLRLRDQREIEPDAYNTYGNLLMGIGQSEKSLAVFNKAITKYPAYTLFYLNKGLNFFNQERYAEAESVFKETLLINPYQYEAHFLLGLCAIHEGKIVPAFLSFAGYLLINPRGKYSQRCINILESISRGKDEILEYKNKRTEEGDENYALAEEILLSKIALEKEYKLNVSLDDPIFRQIQVLFEKLAFKEADPDFWMQYYVPYFKKLFNDNQFEPYIFWSFGDAQLKEIKDYNDKNKKKIDQLKADAGAYFDEIRATRVLTFSKRTDQQIRYRYSDGVLQGKGELMKNGNYAGSWTFYYPSGNIKSTGQFNETGKEGNWIYYSFSGDLQGREGYRNGKLDGKQLYYSEQGLLTYDKTYLNGQENGPQYAYFMNGQLFSMTQYKSGKMDGEYKGYYFSGQLNMIKQYSNNILSGPFTTYYKSGQLWESGNYLNGALEGPYKDFYENGQLSSEGLAKNNLRDGLWKNYYDNGKLKYRTSSVNMKQEGEAEEFYEDGPLQTRYNYKNGMLTGPAVSFDKDQMPFAKYQFADNKLQSVAYFDKAGRQIGLSEAQNNRLELDIFRPDGTKTTHRFLDEKGEIDGQETDYYASGKIKQVIGYKHGQKDSVTIEYFLNGKKKSEQTMKNGKQDGPFISYFPNGNIESEGWFEDDHAAGFWNYYDEMGNLNHRYYMEGGELSGYNTEYYTNGTKSIEKKFYKGLLEEMKQFDSTGKLLIYDSFPQFTGKFLLVYPNGNKLQECNYVKGAFDGPLKQYYFDGSLEFVQYYKSGLLDSSYISYYYHHVKEMEGQYKAGKKTGLWKHYNEDGRLAYTQNFSDDELNGLFQYYDDHNKIDLASSYRHNTRNGLTTNTDPDGNILYSVRYEDGLVAGYSYLNKEGKAIPEVKADHEKLQINAFFQNGRPSRQCQYVDSKIDGIDILYYSNGKVQSRDSAECGLYEGTSRAYYPNGNPQKTYNYRDDRPYGQCFEYNENGVLVRDINYYNGMRQGETKYYSEKGILLETRFYYDNVLLAVKR